MEPRQAIDPVIILREAKGPAFLSMKTAPGLGGAPTFQGANLAIGTAVIHAGTHEHPVGRP